MPAVQPKTTCSIRRSHARHSRPADLKTFDAAEKVMTEILVACGLVGQFLLLPVGQCSCKSQFSVVTASDEEVYIKLMPGGTDTGWKYKIPPPPGTAYTCKFIAGALGSYDPKKAKEKKRDEPKVQEVVEDDNVVTLRPETQPSALGHTMALVVKAYADAFIVHPNPERDALLECLEVAFNWDRADAEQGLQLTVNRGYIRQLTGTERFEVVNAELKRLLIEAGALPPDAPKPAETVQPPADRDELLDLVAAAVAENPNMVKVIPPVPVEPVKKVAAAKKASSPPAKPASATKPPRAANTQLTPAEQIERLETLAKEYREAQAKLAQGNPKRVGREAVVAEAKRRLALAERAVVDAELALAALDGEDTEALAIVSDPEHMHAQAKLDLIKSILQP
jgi:hypothetical protein